MLTGALNICSTQTSLFALSSRARRVPHTPRRTNRAYDNRVYALDLRRARAYVRARFQPLARRRFRARVRLRALVHAREFRFSLLYTARRFERSRACYANF